MNKNSSCQSEPLAEPGKLFLFAPACMPSARAPKALINMKQQPVMPVRLCYVVARPRRLAGLLRGIPLVTSRQGFYWFATDDGNSGKVGQFKREKPVIIGRAKIHYKQQLMLLDSDSFNNAITLVNYLEQQLPQDVAELTEVFTYNRWVFLHAMNSVRLVEYSNYDKLFSESNLELFGKRDLSPQSPEELERQEKQNQLVNYPVIEKFMAWTNDDGIENLISLLQLRFAIARAISDGVTGSMWDFFTTFISHKDNADN